MNTHTDPHTPTNPNPDPSGDGDHWWPRLVDRINAWWMNHEPTWPALRDMATIPPATATAAILATAAALTAAVAALVWWIVSTVVAFIAAVIDAAGTNATTGAHHVAGWSLTRTITEPVRDFLTTHTTGLPLTPDQAWNTWLAGIAVLFLGAVLGSRGARIGWTILGAATAAMAYTATADPGRPVAAGLAVTVWALLSIAAFNRTAIDDPPRLHLVIPRRPARPADTDD